MEPKTIYNTDSDQDGLMDAVELDLGTNPLSSDTDSDGLTDLEEVQQGTIPNKQQPKEKTYDLDF